VPSSVVNSSKSIEPAQPKRVLGFRDLFLFFVVTGISLRWIASAAAVGPSSIVIWLGAWLFFYVPLAFSVMELSSRYPNEGGLYVWSRRAFGDFGGFICAWVYWTSYFPYLPAVLYFAAGNALYIRQQAWGHLANSPSYYISFSVVALALATLFNLLGLSVGRWLHNVGAFGMWVPVGIIFVMGVLVWTRFGSATVFNFHTIIPSANFKTVSLWAIFIFAFGGSETASFMGDEIKDPKRTLPFALLASGLTVALCYILGTISVLVALPVGEVSSLQGLMQAVSKAALRIGLESLIPFAAILITISNVGAMSAFLAATARLPFVAGSGNFLPKFFGALHPRWRTPWFALLLQAGIGVIFLFLGQFGSSVSNAYGILVSMGVITYFIPYLFLFASLWKLQSEPTDKTVIRIPCGVVGAKFISAIGICTSLFAIVLSLFPGPNEPNQVLPLLKVLVPVLLLIVMGALIYKSGQKARFAHPRG
jgi:amino acid transporter